MRGYIITSLEDNWEENYEDISAISVGEVGIIIVVNDDIRTSYVSPKVTTVTEPHYFAWSAGIKQ